MFCLSNKHRKSPDFFVVFYSLSFSFMDKSAITQEKKPGFFKKHPKIKWTLIIIFGMAFIGNLLPDTNHNNAISAQQFCEISIWLQLKDESSAVYSDQSVKSLAGNQWEIIWKVSAKNSFNAEVKSPFSCKLQYDSTKNSFAIIESKIEK